MASINDRLDIETEGWRPDPGDKIEGTVVSLDTRPSDYGDDYPVIELMFDDGNGVLVHAFHSVLKNEISRQKPDVGDRMGIKYFGKVQAKKLDSKGKPVEFEKYKVVVDKAAATVDTPDWDSMNKSSAADVEAETGATPDAYVDEEPF